MHICNTKMNILDRHYGSLFTKYLSFMSDEEVGGGVYGISFLGQTKPLDHDELCLSDLRMKVAKQASEFDLIVIDASTAHDDSWKVILNMSSGEFEYFDERPDSQAVNLISQYRYWKNID